MRRARLGLRNLLSALLGVCLLLPAAPAIPGAYEDAYPWKSVSAHVVPPGSEPVPEADISDAWAEAKARLDAIGMPVPPHFSPPGPITRVRLDYHAGKGLLFGLYLATPGFNRTGQMVVGERIVVFLDDEKSCMLHNTLVHEMLHALHARLAHLDPAWKKVGDEDFVRRAQGDEYDDFGCLEEN